MSGFAARVAGFARRDRNSEATLRPASVPARIMVPRILFLGCSVGLVLFGLLMIYSSSSIIGLTSKQYGYDPGYFLVRQIMTAGMGVLFAAVLARLDYHLWQGNALKVVWVLTLMSLAVVYTPIAGHDAYGATRWIALGSFTLQPSEFAKVTIVLTGAHIASQRYEHQSIDDTQAAKLMFCRGGGSCPARRLFQGAYYDGV